jgi:hypothetical protein
MKYLLLFLLPIFVGCSYYTVSKDTLIASLPNTEDVYYVKDTLNLAESQSKELVFSKKKGYFLHEIEATNDKGDTLNIVLNSSSTFIISTLDNKKVKLYAPRVFRNNEMLYGQRSMILNSEKKVPLDNIKLIELYIENGLTK